MRQKNFIYIYLCCSIFAITGYAHAGVGLRYPALRLAGVQGPVVALTAQADAQRRFLNTPILLRDNSSLIIRNVEVDLEKGMVTITETVLGMPLQHPFRMPLAPFITRRIQQNNQHAWRQMEIVVEEKTRKAGLLQIDIPVEFPKAISRHIGSGGQLRVSGYQKIEFAGRSQWNEGDNNIYAEGTKSWIPRLEMDMESEFKIEGKIGDKIHVYVDQSTERFSETENAIKINYTGDEDEIIQEIEAGNTSLSLPNTHFVSVNEKHKGLFGIKVKMKIGYLDVTAIASQQKGSSEKKNIPLGSSGDEQIIKDYNYKKRTYYSFHTNASDSITDIEVFIANTGTRSNNFETGYFFTDYGNGNYRDTVTKSQPIKLLDGDAPEYEIFGTKRGSVPYIRFNTRKYIGEKHVIGIAYTYYDISGTMHRVGGIEGNNVWLKLIKPEEDEPGSPTWNYEWKNVYSMGGTKVDVEGFGMSIYRNPDGGGDAIPAQGGVSYLELFGFDNGRGAVDKSSNFFDFERGEIIFPYAHPFNDNVIHLADRVPTIYNSPRAFEDSKSKFFMKVRAQSVKKTYDLGYMNIIKGSEVVTLNGSKMPSSVYSIRYETGQITLRDKGFYEPGADVNVTFEYMPFFTPDQKTLLGLRAELKFWDNSHIGFTTLYKRQTTLDRRIQIGREPTQGLIWDIDASFKFKPRWMTRMVDALPLITTEAPSAFDISGEYAQSFSNPNVEGEAVIDDFEGSRLSTDLGIIRSIWTNASHPDTSLIQAFPSQYYNEAVKDSVWMASKGRLNWYNPIGNDRIKAIDIWPKRNDERSSTIEDEQNVLQIQFTPHDNDTLSWGGLMQYLYDGAHDQTKAKFLEVWVKGAGGRISFDLGKISEDVIPNGRLDSEDKNRDGILTEDEDVGLDGFADGVIGDTPHDDYRYVIEQDADYTYINGTEGNYKDPLRYGRFDTEDLDGDNENLPDFENDYYSISIDLADTQYVVSGTYAWDHKITSAQRDSLTPAQQNVLRQADWRLYRIPLWNAAGNNLCQYGNPETYLIQYVRMWFTGFARQSSITLASLEIVSNEWFEQQQTGTDTAEFNVSVKNEYENADYDMPEEVHDKYLEELSTYETSTSSIINEQALTIEYAALQPGAHVAAYNDNFYKPLNFSSYRALKFYVNGVSSPTDGSVDFFLRFGSDSSNYYGVRIIPEPGWTKAVPDQGWQAYIIDFARLTNLKLQSLNADSLERAQTGGLYRTDAGKTVLEVYGNPTLTAIKWMQLGVLHDPQSAGEATGEIWVDDLILIEPKKESGNAMRMSFNTVLADLGRFSGNFEYRDSGFRSLNESVESLREQHIATVSGNMAMGKFFPKKWGISLPLTGSMNTSEEQPKYKPNTDIELIHDEDRLNNQSYKINRRASVAFKKSARSDNMLLAYTLDRMDIDYTISHQFNRSTQFSARVDTLKEYQAVLRYNLTPTKKISITPFSFLAGKWMPKKITGAKLFYLPNNLNSQFTMHREYRKEEELALGIPSIDTTKKFTSKYDIGYMPLNGLNITYGLNLVNNALGKFTPELIKEGNINLGRELQRDQTLAIQLRPNWFTFWSQSYTFRNSYNEIADPRRVSGLYQSGKRDIRWDRDYGLDYTWSLVNLQRKFPAKKKVVAKPFSHAWFGGYLKNGLFYMGKVLPSVTTRYKKTETASDYGLLERPALTYQFGIDNYFTVSRDTDSLIGTTVRNSRVEKEHKDLGITSSLKVGPANIQFSYDYMFKNNIVFDKQTYDRSQTWPRLTLQFRSVEKLPYLNKILRASSLNSSYSRDVSESGDLDDQGSWVWYIDGEHTRETEMVRNAFTPLCKWSLQWKNKVSSTFEYQVTNEETKVFEGNNTITRKNNQTFSFTTQYAFSAPHGLKFWKLKKIKFNRSLNTSITVALGSSYDADKREQDEKFNRKQDMSNWSINTQAKYNFSSKLEGGLQILASQNRKILPSKITQNEAKLAIWAQIKF